MPSIRIKPDDQNPVEIKYGTAVKAVFHDLLLEQTQNPIVGAYINNELVSLTFKIKVNAVVEPVRLNTLDGARMYRRSLSFLLAIAAKEILPDKRLVIGHSLGNGYYFHLDSSAPLKSLDVEKLERRMRVLVEKDYSIERNVLSYSDALELFEKSQQIDTALLLKYRNEGKIPVYQCNGFTDLTHAPLVPSLGLLKTFALELYPPGLMLNYPAVATPETLDNKPKNKLLFSIYQEHKTWGKILDTNSVGKLNERLATKKLKEFVRVAEALHEKKIAEIADRIFDRKDEARIVLIAGPSSSGKTTFTKRLAIQLRVIGIKPVIISLDDYFVSRDQTPKDENGEYNFESIHAIDIQLLNRDLLQLFDGETVEIPTFDFKTGERKYTGNTISLTERSILLMEGIHGLNDQLTPKIPASRKFKIYVSALTQISLDDHNRIPTTDNRLLRRMVRDNKFRGHSALKTLHMWPSVRRGEDQNIFPFQDNADAAFNSALDYELAVLKSYAEPLLKAVKPYHQEYSEAVRLLRFLYNFLPMDGTIVPNHSILREFIGGSAFHY